MKTRRILVCLLAVLLSFTLLGGMMSVSAASDVEITVTTSKTWFNVGETVTANVRIKAPAIAALSGALSYDTTKMTLTGISPAMQPTGNGYLMTNAANGGFIMFASAPNNSDLDVTVTCTFTAAESIEGIFDLTFVPAMVVDKDNKVLTTQVTPASVKIGTAVSGVTLNKSAATLNVGATETLSATVAPANATVKTVKWSSSNPAAATVDANGLVTAVAKGTANITVTTDDGGLTATCAVTVKQPVESVSLDKATMTLKAGGATGSLTATVLPANADNQTVTWISSAPAVATVANGVVTPLTKGTTTITVTTEDGNKTATCEVTVTQPVTGVTLDRSTLDLQPSGAPVTLVATVNPANADNKTVTWSSSAPGVATVVDGVVTPVSVGTTTITVTTEDGGKTATCAVTVGRPVTGVTLSQSTLSMYVGGTKTLTAAVIPSDATNQGITWSSDNTAVATVAGGVITGVSKGSAIITVTAADGGFTATCAVTVSIKSNLTVFAGEDVRVPVTAESLNKVNMLAGTFTYDSTLLTYKSHTGSDSFPSMQVEGNSMGFFAPAGVSGTDVVLGYITFTAKADLTADASTLVQFRSLLSMDDDFGMPSITIPAVGVDIYTIPMMGDVTGDGRINVADAVLLMQYLAGNSTLNAKQLRAADVVKDGAVNVIDATAIMQMCLYV